MGRTNFRFDINLQFGQRRDCPKRPLSSTAGG
jgi:hypothetical protein